MKLKKDSLQGAAMSKSDHKSYDDPKDEFLFKTLFDSIAEGLVITDLTGTIRNANPRAGEMFGYSIEELIGEKVEMLIPNQLRSRHESHRAEYNKKPRKRSMGSGMNLLARCKDGSELPVEISLNHFRTAEGGYILALITDITERKNAEEALKKLNTELEVRVEERTAALRETQKLYNAIARNFPKGIINVFDRELRYAFVEGMELYKLGITGKDLIGTRYPDRLPEILRPSIEETLGEVFEGKSKVLEFEFKDNFYALNAVPLPDLKGEIQQILVVERNVTEERLAQNRMKQNLEKERELNELKSRFVSMASHEFRTPLSTILSSVTLIDKYREANLVEKQGKHVDRIRQSVANLTGILNDFLSLDRLETGDIQSRIESFDLKALSEEVVGELEQIKKKGQKIRYAHAGSTTMVESDQHMVKNIIINLVSNAIKYSDENDLIALSTHREPAFFAIRVKDEGIGIPKEEQDKLFSRFFRAGNVTNIQGTGLGLNIVKKYVELLGGEVDFSSVQNEGSTFSVVIPLKEEKE